MVGAIFHVKGAQSITGDKGIEFDLILLAVALVIIVAGPGRDIIITNNQKNSQVSSLIFSKIIHNQTNTLCSFL